MPVFDRAVRRVFQPIIWIMLFFPANVLFAQITSVSDPTSTPIPGVGHDYIKLLSETVNPASGSLSVRVSVPVPPGRKLTTPFAYTYDSSGAWFLESVAAGSQPPVMSSVSNSNIAPLALGGWAATFPQLSRVLFQQVPNHPVNDGNPTCDALTGYVFTDPSGGRHSLGLSHWYNSSWQACQPSPFSEIASGGNDDFYRASLVGALNSISNYDGTPEIADPDGTVYNFGSFFNCSFGPGGNPGALPPLASGLPTSIEDRNGNIVKITTDANHDGCSGFIATDTVGRTALSVSHYGYTLASNLTSTISVAGLSQPYTVTWSKVSPTGLSISHTQIGSNNNCWAPPTVAAAWTPFATSNTGAYVVTAIALPNGQQYTFGYDSVTGFIKKITYPSGGYVSYTWGINPNSAGIQYNDKSGNPAYCAYLYDTPAITQRSVSFDGNTVALTQTFSYSTNWGTLPPLPNGPYLWVGKQATVTTTDNINGTTSKITYNYIPNTVGLGVPNLSSNTSNFVKAAPVENTISYYGNSPSYPLLRTETKNWFDQFELACDLITLNDGSGQVSGAFYNYSTYGGQVTDKKEYDYGQLTSTSNCLNGVLPPNSPTPARETIITYQTFAATPIYSSGPSIFDRPASVKIYANGTLAGETDYSYDQTGVATATTPAGTHDETNYGVNSAPPRGNVTTLTKQCFPGCLNPIVTYTYDEAGQNTTRIDPRGNITSYSYTDNYSSGTPPGQTDAYLTQITGAAQTQKFGYAYSTGELTSYTDQNNQITSYKYVDSLNRLTETDFPDGGVSTNSYTDTPLAVTMETKHKIDSSRWTDSFTLFDGLGQTIAHSAANGEATPWDRVDTCLDGFGRQRFTSYPYQLSGPTTVPNCTSGVGDTFTYDALGRTTQVSHSDGTTVLTTYTGRATQVQDEGNGTHRVSRVSQTDGLGRLNSICEVSNTTLLVGSFPTPSACGQDIPATGFLTTYSYDTLGHLSGVTQAGLNGRSFSYDSLSRLRTATNPEAGPITYTYDSDTNCPSPNAFSTLLVSKLDARNVRTCMQYDNLNRLTQKNYSDGTPTANFFYDQTSAYGVTLANTIGRKSSETTASPNPTAGVFSYDQLGRVTINGQCTPLNCSSNTVYPLTYVYDFAGDMTSSTNGQSNTYGYTYNVAQRLLTMTSNAPHSPTTMFSAALYNAAGSLLSATLGNTIPETRTYDARLRLASINDGTVYNVMIPASGGYAPNSNILIANDSVNGNWTYAYDDFNRLLSASATGQAYTYDYDRYGNRWHQNGPHLDSRGFDANNRIVSGSGVTYDANGNTTSDGTTNYTYDAENRLTSATNSSRGLTCYVYNAEGQRVRKNYGTVGTCASFTQSTPNDYLYDLSGHLINIIGIRNEVFARDRHLASYTFSTTFFMHADWLGTERARSNISGASYATCTSLPFGDWLTCAGGSDPSPDHFTGKQHDYESGLENFEARFDSSSMGRFMSPDEALSDQDATAPQSWNLYSYVRNNPLNNTDPDGEACVSNDGGRTFHNDGSGGQRCKDAEVPHETHVTDKAPRPRLPNLPMDSLTMLICRSCPLPPFDPKAEVLGAPVGPIGPIGSLLTETAEDLTVMAKLSAILREAAAGKGNFGLGTATAAEAAEAGEAWVGQGAKVATDGKTLISADELRQYRPPSLKPGLGKVQANFESRQVPRGQWQSNGHLDIK